MAIESLMIKIGAVQAGGGVLNALGSKLKGISESSEEIKNNFRDATKYLKGAGTAAILTHQIGKGFMTGATAAGNLQKSVKDLKKELISPEKSLQRVNEELSQIEDAAFSIQAKTPFDQGAVINQATILKKAGLDVEAIANGALEATALLASVEGMNPETAASIQAVGDSAFDLANKADGFVNFADLMSRASSLAFVSVEDLGESFTYAGGVAKRMSFNARETSVALAALAKGGIKASQGGTTFASIFADLETKRPDLVFDKVTKKALPMAQIIANLNKEFDGLTDEARSKKMNKIFGRESAKGVEVLVSNYENLNKEIDKQASLTEKVDVVLEGYEAKLNSLKGTAGSTLARLFTPALDPLSKLVDKTNEFVTSIGEATKGENTLGKVVSGTSAGALAVGGAATLGLGALSLMKFKNVLKKGGGLKGLFRGAGGTAAGIAKGSLISKITGGAVQEVYVVNADEIGGGVASSLPGTLPGIGKGAGGAAAGGFFANIGMKLKALFPTFTKWIGAAKTGLVANFAIGSAQIGRAHV